MGNKKGKTELKAMCDFKKKKSHIFFLVSRYLGHDTIHVSPAQVSRCIDASMHRYALNVGYHDANNASTFGGDSVTQLNNL